MSIFITMIVVILSEIYIKNNQNVHFKHVQFILYQLLFSVKLLKK